MFKPGKATVVIGGQWGSEGKGKLYSYLYDKYPIDATVSDFMPNAGHTAWIPGLADGPEVKVISKALPMGAHFPQVEQVMLGPHSVVDLTQFYKEVSELDVSRGTEPLTIRSSVMLSVLEADDAEQERASLRGISSTMQGSSRAIIRKIERALSGARLTVAGKLGETQLSPTISVVNAHTDTVVNGWLDAGMVVLIESAQGFDLGLNHGHQWPYVTSRDCAVGRLLDNAGISFRRVESVIGVIRPHPIRVGSLEGASSGPYYHDQEELDWRKISAACGKKIEERTTVTNRIRRVFSFSWYQLDRFLRFVRPDFLCLNFADYLINWDAYAEAGLRHAYSITKHPFVKRLRSHCKERGCELRFIGFGPRNSEMIELS